MPAFAPVAPSPALPAAGLVPKGRYEGFVANWAVDPNGDVPNSGHHPAGEILRLRWLGTPVAAEVLNAGSVSSFTDTFANPSSIAPGSIAITVTIGGNAFFVRDTGDGRLIGQDPVSGATANGTINYLTGELVVTLSTAADAVNITADYEHDCLYLPLDLNIEWDAQMADG
jgi:hypothetical protein